MASRSNLGAYNERTVTSSDPDEVSDEMVNFQHLLEKLLHVSKSELDDRRDAEKKLR